MGELRVLAEDRNPDIIAITESWSNSDYTDAFF